MFYYNGVGMVVDLQGVAHWQACPSVPICAVLLPCTEGASTTGGPCAHQVMAGGPCVSAAWVGSPRPVALLKEQQRALPGPSPSPCHWCQLPRASGCVGH